MPMCLLHISNLLILFTCICSYDIMRAMTVDVKMKAILIATIHKICENLVSLQIQYVKLIVEISCLCMIDFVVTAMVHAMVVITVVDLFLFLSDSQNSLKRLFARDKVKTKMPAKEF